MDELTQDSPVIVDLVRRAQRRDPEAFTALIRRYERMALGVAYGATPDAHTAGDVVQDAFAKAWQKLPDLKEPGRFATWLCGIVRNGAIDLRRRAKVGPRAALDDVPESGVPASAALAGRDSADDPSSDLQSREERALIATALDTLDEISRTAIALRYYEGLSSKEIGELLDMNPTAVDMRLSRARQQLKQALLTTQAFADKRAETA